MTDLEMLKALSGQVDLNYQEISKLSKWIVGNLKESDYEFTIHFDGFAWDVYKFDVKFADSEIPPVRGELKIWGQIVLRIGRAAKDSSTPCVHFGLIPNGSYSAEELLKVFKRKIETIKAAASATKELLH